MGVSRPSSAAMRVALLQGAMYFTPALLDCLRERGIAPLIVDRPEAALQSLDASLEAWDAVVYPISAQWQRALDFLRAVRRIRERSGGCPYPPVLVLSAAEQLPVTVGLFRRVSGTRYSVFTSPEDLVRVLESMREETLKAKRATQRLYLRLVHSGNPAGLGCIQNERLLAVYGSFRPGQEEQIKESNSVLLFLNLLAMNRWRFRTASEIIQLMSQNPFYASEGASAKVISLSSVKTYVRRCEAALVGLWRQMAAMDEPPTLIAREPRGGKEIAYRLMSACEIDHV